MKSLKIVDEVGEFAEDKDEAAKLRREIILPAVKGGEKLELDFKDVRLTTQSFIHALISEALRTKGEETLSLIQFANCGDAIRGIIETVVQYVLETIDEDG